MRAPDASATASPRGPWVWLLDVLIVCFGGLVAGLVLGRGGELRAAWRAVSVRGLYTPVLLLTVLVGRRAAMLCVAPTLDASLSSWSAADQGAAARRALACAGRCRPCSTALGERFADGRFVSPPIFWRSSPRGVDLLAFVTPNP